MILRKKPRRREGAKGSQKQRSQDKETRDWSQGRERRKGGWEKEKGEQSPIQKSVTPSYPDFCCSHNKNKTKATAVTPQREGTDTDRCRWRRWIQSWKMKGKMRRTKERKKKNLNWRRKIFQCSATTTYLAFLRKNRQSEPQICTVLTNSRSKIFRSSKIDKTKMQPNGQEMELVKFSDSGKRTWATDHDAARISPSPPQQLQSAKSNNTTAAAAAAGEKHTHYLETTIASV